MSTIGDRLTSIADELYEENKAALSRALDMSPQTFHKYFKNDRKPGTPVLLKLLEIGININWLLTGDGEMLLGQPMPNDSEGTLDNIESTYVEHYLIDLEHSVKHWFGQGDYKWAGQSLRYYKRERDRESSNEGWFYACAEHRIGLQLDEIQMLLEQPAPDFDLQMISENKFQEALQFFTCLRKIKNYI